MLGGTGRKTGKRIGAMTTISPKKGNGTSEISATGGRLPKAIKENDKQRNVSWLRRIFWVFLGSGCYLMMLRVESRSSLHDVEEHKILVFSTGWKKVEEWPTPSQSESRR